MLAATPPKSLSEAQRWALLAALDWTDFTLERAPTQTETRTVEVIPARVRFWTLTGNTDLNPQQMMPVALSAPHEGPPIERVRIWRDELSNRALACEDRSATSLGSHRVPRDAARGTSERTGWVYTLTPRPPVNWWPLEVQARPSSAQIDFRPLAARPSCQWRAHPLAGTRAPLDP